ncbi:uncharacterized protein RCC_06549 [Ramularia collo-cygni]|uniref:Peptidase A1 domain-containing protein n=1 Tax=Ramularia collo-cygni TaxID=112498 RepID=A0A2D3UVH6_9PEZI|nr:uncharacterized protein RCC_06549 [Ramularia collo-cygni]CZT20691.1 uncharacterized protein RCC_06549 [Ramularia collo-cygni]
MTFSDGKIADQNFRIEYGDGEFLTGEMGYQDVTFSGITVDNQQVALVDYAYWFGDGESSGLLGFAYPGITSAFSGPDPDKDTNNNSIVYNPFFFNAIEQGKTEPMFSLALTRETEGEAGQLAFGCLPNIPYKGDFVSTPLEVFQFPGSAVEITEFTYYTIIPDAYIISHGGATKEYFNSEGILLTGQPSETRDGISNTTLSNTTPVIVDSGSTLVSLSTALAAKVNALFDPPATYMSAQDVYEVDCNATPPKFGVRIAGHDFYLQDQDLLLTGELGLDPDTGMCITGVQPFASEPFILGDTFLKNVVAVFDVGKGEMRFAEQ